ncbi:MAG: right-handed parallel beta-helix repeat-containing protein, partial [bacterium]|nr:right-handed parallel beta-helix repeat-containing protein [bacterium]
MKTLSPVRNSCGVILVLGLATSVGAQSVLYVDDDAPPGGDGLAWATAFFDLQDALDAAAASGGVVTEIRLAQGTYTPDRGTGDREASFEMLDGVAIRGGYAGLTEPNPDERDPVLYESVLSGDLFGDDLAGGGCALEPSNCCYAHAYPGCDNASCEESVCAAYPECCAEDWYWHCAEEARDCDGVCWNGLAPNCENSLHVVYASGVGASAVLDGCTITGGNADRHGAPGGEESGGGVYIVGGSPTFDACTIEWNTAEDGGGVANNQGSPAFSNCAIRSNWVSFGFGGGLMSTDGDPSFFNCSFFRNSANFAGGAVQASGGWAQFSECIFIANESFIQGGAYLGTSGDVSFTDCTFADNVSHAGGAVLLGSSGTLPGDVATLTRCTFNGNTALDDGGALY